MSDLFFLNLMTYSLQLGLLIVVATAIPPILRLRRPDLLLRFWQGVLLVAVLLPVLQPWQVRTVGALPGAATEVGVIGAPLFLPQKPAGVAPVRLETESILTAILAAGFGLRLLWLALGLFRLQVHRRSSRLWAPPPQFWGALQRALGTKAELRLSSAVSGPSTFGIFRPTVLLPHKSVELPPSTLNCILHHELIHVCRRHWLSTVVEELFAVLFWFHPAVWWAIRRLRLAREQCVDAEVVRVRRDPGEYVRSLLEVAQQGADGKPTPAAFFLEEHLLTRRAQKLLKEIPMTRKHVVLSIFLAGIGVLAVCWSVVLALPLQQEPVARTTLDAAEGQQHAIRVGAKVQESKLLARVEPTYPERALEAQVQGQVILQVEVSEGGDVAKVEALRGHPLLIPAAVDAVSQWKYEPTYINGEAVRAVATVTVNFRLTGSQADVRIGRFLVGLDSEGNLKVESLVLNEDELVDRVTRRPDVWLYWIGTVDALVVREAIDRLYAAGAEDVQVVGTRNDGSEPLDENGHREAKLIRRVTPSYTSEALEAKLEGVVLLECLVGTDGRIAGQCAVLRGIGMGLDEAAASTVSREWRFIPAYENWKPVERRVTIEVAFRVKN